MAKEKSSKSSSKKSKEKVEKKVKKIRYKAFKEEFKGNAIIAIREVDKEGNFDEDKNPVFAFGKTKAKALLTCIDEVQEIFDEL